MFTKKLMLNVKDARLVCGSATAIRYLCSLSHRRAILWYEELL